MVWVNGGKKQVESVRSVDIRRWKRDGLIPNTVTEQGRTCTWLTNGVSGSLAALNALQYTRTQKKRV